MPPLLHGEAEAGRYGWTRRAFPAPLRRAQGRQKALTLPRLDPERRGELLQRKLAALIRGQWPNTSPVPERLPFGAAMADGTTGWVLSDGQPPVGGALGWATGLALDRLHVLTDHGGGSASRQLADFRIEADVWLVAGAALQPVEPEPLDEPPEPDADLLALVPDLEAAGAEVVIEGGVLRAEVLGLEVARVGRDDDGRPHIEIGVGRHDRYAHALLGTIDLAGVVAQVREQRRAGVPLSPANQLAPERWLRAVAIADPSLVGATHLDLLPSPVVRPDLRRRAPAPAAGTDGEGAPVVVVFSVGVDPELVPAASDARQRLATNHRLVVAVPEGDDLPVTRRLAALLREPAEVVTVSREWRQRSPK